MTHHYETALDALTFLFDEGDRAVFIASDGNEFNVRIIARNYDARYPQYVVCQAANPFCTGSIVRQEWLRPYRKSPKEVREFAAHNSPPITGPKLAWVHPSHKRTS